MAFELHDKPFPGLAASNIGAGVAVKLANGEREVCPVGSNNEEAFGVTHAVATRGEGVAVHVAGEVVKVTAAASIAAGADVVPAVPSLGYAGQAAASGVLRFAVGKNVSGPVNPGETFSLYIRPKQLGGLA
jgi:hypothetical protein